MSDTWATRWAASWAAEAQRFNMTHVPAGSATGGQFGTSSGGSSAAKAGAGGAKAPAKGAKPAAKAAHPGNPPNAARKARLHAQAKADRAQAAKLTIHLHALEKQEAA